MKNKAETDSIKKKKRKKKRIIISNPLGEHAKVMIKKIINGFKQLCRSEWRLLT